MKEEKYKERYIKLKWFYKIQGIKNKKLNNKKLFTVTALAPITIGAGKEYIGYLNGKPFSIGDMA